MLGALNSDRYSLCELIIPDSIPQDLYDICAQLEMLTIDEAELILDALQHQLWWGYAQAN